MKYVNMIGEDPGSGLSNLVTLFHLLNKEDFMLNNPGFYREVNYKFSKIINKHSLSQHFIRPQLPAMVSN